MSSLKRDELPAVSRELARAFREDESGEAELQRAYWKFLQKRPVSRRSHPLQVLGWIVAGMLLGMGSLYAASATWRPMSFSWIENERRQAKGTESQPTARAPVVAPLAEAAEPAAPLPAASVAPTPAAPALAPSASAARESWQRAAQGLREHDFDTANDALLKLAQQGTSNEREAAQLVRAQLLLSQGRAADARAELLRLERSAHSEAIRLKAGELRAAALKSRPSERSFDAVEGTKQP
jgi:hypothetical protein